MTYHEYTTPAGNTTRRHYQGIRRPANQIDLDEPRSESAYDHIDGELLSELKYRFGTGGTHEFVSAIPQEDWGKANELAREKLSPKKEETGVAAPVSQTEKSTRDVTTPHHNTKSNYGIITRIEFRDFPNEEGIRVEKYADGWTPNSRPVDISLQRELSLDQMTGWLEARGWKIYRWEASPVLGVPAGARAYKGEPRSVRTKAQLKVFRDQLVAKSDAYFHTPESFKADYDKLAGMVHALDLAYQL